jgi:1-deoxy-D-xylulose-5-phosphate reductoisomerase
MKRGIAILGSTGSIGTQALDVIRDHTDKFSVEVLSAQNNLELLIRQAREFVPNAVVIGNEDHYTELREALENLPVKVYCGIEALNQVVEMESINMVLTAMVGFAGLNPTMKAIEAGKNIALANKETMVVAGELIMRLAREKGVAIIPVDSEHSALFQSLMGESLKTIEKVILTASGGPFINKSAEELKGVSPQDALQHPNWCMGPKITIDSASMMNKGLEVIEAKWLFDLKPSQIEVVVHPQSIIHSMVQFIDGSVKAQMGPPDMRLPIQYALGFPERLTSGFKRLDFTEYPNLTFQAPDTKIFRNLALSFETLEKGGNWPCIMNAANEIAVEAFLEEKIGFMDIPEVIEQALAKSLFIQKPNIADLIDSDRLGRDMAQQFI